MTGHVHDLPELPPLPPLLLLLLQGLPGSLPWGMFTTFLNDYYQTQYGLSVGVSWARSSACVLLAPRSRHHSHVIIVWVFCRIAHRTDHQYT